MGTVGSDFYILIDHKSAANYGIDNVIAGRLPFCENDQRGTVIADWRRNAQQHDGDNYEFLRSLKVRDYGYDPDELAS